MHMRFAERKCRRREEHDWRADGFDKYSPSVCAHADWMVCRVNIGVNVDLLSCALALSNDTVQGRSWGEPSLDRRTAFPTSFLVLSGKPILTFFRAVWLPRLWP